MFDLAKLLPEQGVTKKPAKMTRRKVKKTRK
jgi:hypothetical protein